MAESQDKKQTMKKVVQLSWPIMIDTVMASLFGMVDMLVVGNYTGSKYSQAANMSAIGLTNQPIWIVLALVQALGVGGTTLIARASGARRYNRLQVILKHALLLGIALTIPLVIVLFVFQENIFLFLGAEREVILAGWQYYRYVVIGLFFNCIAAILIASVRGVGETKPCMQINIIANVTNLVLNILLVNGIGLPEMGVAGAGFATMVSNILSCVLMIYYVTRRSVIRVSWTKKTPLVSSIFKTITKLGLPAMVEQLLLRGGVLLYTRIVASLGTAKMAAHQIVQSIYNLSITPGQALGTAASTLVGQELGDKDPQKADLYGKTSARLALYLGIVIGILIYIFRYPLAGLYTSDKTVVDLVAKTIIILTFMAPLQLPQLTQVGALRGAGDTFYPMLITGFSVLVVRVISAHILVKKLSLGLIGAWLAMFLDQAVRSIIMTLRYRKGAWKNIEV